MPGIKFYHSCLTLLQLQVWYGAVRRQGPFNAGQPEFKLLNYQTSVAELMPVVASAYALILMVSCMFLLWILQDLACPTEHFTGNCTNVK